MIHVELHVGLHQKHINCLFVIRKTWQDHVRQYRKPHGSINGGIVDNLTYSF